MKRNCFLVIGFFPLAWPSLAYGVEDLVIGSANTNPTRAVVGSDAEVTFRLFNNTTGAIDFSLTPQGITSGGAITGPGTPIPGGTGPVPQTLQLYSFKADTSGAAGTMITTGLTATQVLPGTSTASATHDIHLLENRTINFSLSSGTKTSVGGVLDLGRYIGAYNGNFFNSGNNAYSSSSTYGYWNPITLSISGGAQGHDLAADVTYKPTAMNYFSYNNGRSLVADGGGSGLSLSAYGANSTPFTFDAANVTATASLSQYKTGQYSDTYHFGSAANLGTAFQNEAGVAGAAAGFGDPVTIMGTSLANRFITASSSASGGAESNRVNQASQYYYGYGIYFYGDHPSTEALAGKLDSDVGTAGIQNRVMLGSSGNIAAGNETWTIASPGGDNNFARVKFTGSGTLTNGAVSVDTGSGDTLFNGTTTRDIAASWSAQTFGTSASSDISTTTVGFKGTMLDLTSNLSSGETSGPLAGQQLGSLSVGYSLQVVRDRNLQVANVNETAFNSVGQVYLGGLLYGDSGHVTNPTAHFEPVNAGGSSNSLSLSSSINAIYDQFDAGTGSGSGSRTIQITPEGLAGERAAYNLTYNWTLNRVNEATMQEGGSLATPGSSDSFISITRTNETGLSASVGTFQWSQTNGGSAAKAVVNAWDNLGDGWSANPLGLGTSNASFNFVFDDTGLSNGTYFGYYETVASHAILASGKSIIGSYYGDLGYNGFWMEAVVSGREDTTAYQGFRLDNFQATAPPTVSATVEGKSGAFRILDIVDTSATRGVSMQVLSSLGSVGSGANELSFVSGSIKGLDGITFVLESTYDEAEMINLFGSEELAVLLWEKSSGVFVNAVLGNYGDAVEAAIDPLTGEPYDAKLGQRFVGSYEDYLESKSLALGSPQLGDYGYDPVNNTVWAVIDHNSNFGGGIGVIPEPSSILLVFGGSMAALLRRRRD